MQNEKSSGPVNVQLVSRLWDTLGDRRHLFCPRWSQYAIIDSLLLACERQTRQLGAPNLKRLALVQRLLQSCTTPGRKVALQPQQQEKEQEFFSTYLKHAERIHNSAGSASPALRQQAGRLLKAFCDWLLVAPKRGKGVDFEEQAVFYRVGQHLNDFVHMMQRQRMERLVSHSKQLRQALQACDTESA